MVTASPNSGFPRSRIPRAAGSPTCTGAPWTAGKRPLIWTARGTRGAGMGRIVTTRGPLKAPAGGTPGLEEPGLEGEAAPQEEGDEIRCPDIPKVRHLPIELPVPVDPVLR